VLVDSRSSSASEIFARLMQLHRRGMVIGDRTAGSVVTSRFFSHTAGGGRVVPYGFSISVRDVVLPDGERLEGKGMTPDEIVLPSAADLATGRDPVLALGIALAGGGIDPIEAGKLFPPRWDE
jgi:C-terminal processing protease CtpA/Prc